MLFVIVGTCVVDSCLFLLSVLFVTVCLPFLLGCHCCLLLSVLSPVCHCVRSVLESSCCYFLSLFLLFVVVVVVVAVA